jgi:hypothetical protein
MSALTDFLLARIAEDEAAARAAIDPDRPGTHWHWVMDATDTPVADRHLQRAQDDGESVSLRTVEEFESRSGVGPLPHFVVQSGEVRGTAGDHIARHDPARVLAECEAKRQIVEDFQVLHRDYRETHSETTEARRFQAMVTVARLASVYADHPDYREEWRP